MNDVERALSQIADIRAHLAASTRFRGIAPEANALTGILALAVAAAQTIWPELLAQDALRFIAVWAGVTIASSVIAATEAVSRARSLHGQMANAMLSAALRLVLPFAAAGLIMTFVLCTSSSGTAWMVPGIWLILVGLFGFAALPSLPRAIVWAATWYFLCGAIILGLAGWNGALSPWMMGIPLAVGQGIVALVLHRTNGERDGRA